MRYEQLEARDDAAFRRFCGVSKPTFEAMLEILEQAEAGKKPGRPNKLSLPDQLLLALSYWREYRTLFHIAAEYALHESTAQRIVCRVEDRLAASGRFALSPRDTLLEEGVSDRRYGATDDRRIGAAFSGGFRLDPGWIIRPFRARPQPLFPTAPPAAA